TYPKLIIRPSAQHKHLLNQILGIGLETLSVQSPEVNLAALQWFLAQASDEFQQQLRAKLRGALRMSLEQFVLLAKFLLVNNLAGADSFSAEVLASVPSGRPLELTNIQAPSQALANVQDQIQ